MRCRSFPIAIIGIALTLLAVWLGTEAASAQGGMPPPCWGKQPKPHCGRGAKAVCTRVSACGCVRWTCAFQPPKPPVTKEPLKPPGPLPGRRIR